MIKNISIIIPCLNEEKYIGKSLNSIINQSYSDGYIEVIIVDGKSVDSTRQIVNKYKSRLKKLILLNNTERVTPKSLNIGIREANGDAILILSAHCMISGNFIQDAIKEINSSPLDCVGGPIINQGSNYIGKSIAIAMQSIFGVGNSSFRVSNNKKYVDTIAFGLYRADIFKKIGLFDEELTKNQDYEFNQRIIKYGGKILLLPSIHSIYFSRNSLISLYRQYFLYGYWKVQVIKKDIKYFKLRYQVPVIFIILIILLGLNGFMWNTSWIYLGKLLYIYMMLSIIFSIYLGIKKGMKFFPILPIVFSVLHSAFGLGFTIGFTNNLLKLKDIKK